MSIDRRIVLEPAHMNGGHSDGVTSMTGPSTQPEADGSTSDPGVAAFEPDALLSLFDGDQSLVIGILHAARESILTDMERVMTGAGVHDAHMVAESAHRLKGTAGDLRATRVHCIAATVQRLAQQDSWCVEPGHLLEIARAVGALCAGIEAYVSLHAGAAEWP